ncbi:hypothetical protein DLJ53_07475 [Acuticoccus sediminis]|uniref:Uncharacterized protein n=1 Tax=Acuticoccus sediminis TaxID=2184697 RepID=A0A8B2P2V1_9HYPH|nr:hypothetical protein [Acuticoccus sediminis]RAI04274.1 hypothetical protein DLJ53_07475 [Acuticoccus sediminis]
MAAADLREPSDPLVALLHAAAAGGPLEADAAIAALHELEWNEREELLAVAHAAMRADLSPSGIAPRQDPPPKGKRTH